MQWPEAVAIAHSLHLLREATAPVVQRPRHLCGNGLRDTAESKSKPQTNIAKANEMGIENVGGGLLLTRRRLPSKATWRRMSPGEPRGGEVGLGLGLSVSRGVSSRGCCLAKVGGKGGGRIIATAEGARRLLDYSSGAGFRGRCGAVRRRKWLGGEVEAYAGRKW